ncbi:MAG: penicillin-binding protein activator, partial [Natronospirillum sp.]
DEMPMSMLRSDLIRINRNPQTPESYAIELAKIFQLRSQPDQSSRVLSTLRFDQLTPNEQRDYAILTAKNSIEQFNPQGAMRWLGVETGHLFDRLPLPQQIAISLLRAQALSLSGNPIGAAQERIFLHPLLASNQRSRNIENIWLELQNADLEALDLLAQFQRAPDYTGWLHLARLYHTNQDNLADLAAAVDQWRMANPRHPAAMQLPEGLVRLTEDWVQQPTQLALILPQTGPQADSGQAVLDGFLAGYYHSKNQGHDVPTLRIYDENATDARQLISRAVEEGAEFIIGPLGRDQTFRVESVRNLPVTVMTLNRTDRTVITNDRVIQFGLAPEDEARQVARQAWLEGSRTAALLVPNDDWGQRVSDEFAQHWEELGGNLVGIERLQATDDGRRYLAQVRALLDIDQSEQRATNVRALVGGAIETEPRRRKDLDFVFMAVTPEQARQLRPLLNFQYARELPVLAMSSIATTTSNTRDQDLNGIRLVEIPWQLRDYSEKAELRALDRTHFDTYARLYALGIDSFYLLPRLGQLRTDPQASYAGKTGQLRLSEQGQIERELQWAQYVNGRLVPMSVQETIE